VTTAALKFTQGVSSNTPGKSFKATLGGGAVTIANNDNTGVTAWTYTLMDVPKSSALVPGVLSTGATPTTSITPDVAGSYRIQEVLSGPGGTASQIRDIVVANSRGWILPSYLGVGSEFDFPDPVSPNSRGWASMLETVFLDIHDKLNDFDAMFARAGTVLSVKATEIDGISSSQGKTAYTEGHLQTTGNTLQTILSVDMTAFPNCAITVDAYIVGCRTGAAQMHWYKKSRSWINTAGTLTAGVQKDVDDELVGPAPPGTWVVALNHSGQLLRVQAHGGNDNVTWFAVVQRLRVVPL